MQHTRIGRPAVSRLNSPAHECCKRIPAIIVTRAACTFLFSSYLHPTYTHPTTKGTPPSTPPNYLKGVFSPNT